MYSRGAWIDWYTLAYRKGELIQKFQQALRGSMVSKGREYLGPTLSLMSKGESDLVLLPSGPKGEIVGIMRQVLSLMVNHIDDKLWCNKVIFKFMHFHAKKSFFHVEKSSHTFKKRKVSFM